MDKSAFLKILGNSPITRVLDFLIENQEFDYSLSDICTHSNVGWTTLHTLWPELEKIELVAYTRNVGKAKMYKLNLKNPIARRLVKFDFEISKCFSELELEKQKQKISI